MADNCGRGVDFDGERLRCLGDRYRVSTKKRRG